MRAWLRYIIIISPAAIIVAAPMRFTNINVASCNIAGKEFNLAVWWSTFTTSKLKSTSIF